MNVAMDQFVVVVQVSNTNTVLHVEGPFVSEHDAQAYVDEQLEPGFLNVDGVIRPMYQIDEVPRGAYDVS